MIKQEFFIKDLDDNIIYQLNEIKDLFNIIDLEFKNLNSFILVYMKNVSNNLEELQKLFNVFAEKNKIEKNENQNCLENIKLKINHYFKQISEILGNQNIIKIKELNDQLLGILNKKLNNEIEMDYSIFNKSNKFKSYEEFCDNYKENSEENNNNNITTKFCSKCQASEASIFVKENSKFFCKDCINNIGKNTHEKNIEKKEFLNSLNIIIKSILIRSHILFNEEEPNSDINNKNNKIIQKLSFKYPSIDNINDFDSQIKYLKDINSILINDFGQTNINLNSFKISEINEIILQSIKQYFNFENPFEEISNISDQSVVNDDNETIFNLIPNNNEEENYKERKYIMKENWASITQLKFILDQPLSSCCKIHLRYYFGNKEFINGFFCNINSKKGEIPALFTAYQNFDKFDNLEIEIFNNNNFQKFNLKNRKRVIYSSKKNNNGLPKIKFQISNYIEKLINSTHILYFVKF